jgi:hypothetical protein
MSRIQKMALIMGVGLAVLGLLWPDWIAVHPASPDLSVPLGHAWLWVPPDAPKGFSDMTVHVGFWWWLAWPFVIIVATGSLYLIVSKSPH